MAVNLSIDLNDATFADLVALVDAARAAGVDTHAKLGLDGSTVSLSVAEPAATKPPERHSGPSHATRDSQGAPLGDAAIRSVIDILSGRSEPPR